MYANILETECSVHSLSVILSTDRGRIFSITLFAVFLPSLWAPASTATPAAVPSASAARALALSGRWSNERKIYVDGLLEHLGVVGAIDGSAGLLKGSIFDQGVTLFVSTLLPLPWFLGEREEVLSSAAPQSRATSSLGAVVP